MTRRHLASGILLVMCVVFGGWWFTLLRGQSLHAAFADLPSVYVHVTNDLANIGAGRLPPGLVAAHSEQEIDSSLQGHSFLVVYANYRGLDGRGSGFRGSNGPIYVFERRHGGWDPVGGFVGSWVRFTQRGNDIVAQEYWHASVALDVPNEYLYRDGSFQHWVTTSE